MGLHVLEPAEPTESAIVLPLEEDPAGFVCQTQQPLITSSLAELALASVVGTVQSYGQNYCWLPLTAARRRAKYLTNKPGAAWHLTAA